MCQQVRDCRAAIEHYTSPGAVTGHADEATRSRYDSAIRTVFGARGSKIFTGILCCSVSAVTFGSGVITVQCDSLHVLKDPAVRHVNKYGKNCGGERGHAT